MNCDDARRLTDEFVDGRLASADEMELREHCAACPDCAAALGGADAFVAEVSASFRAARECAPSDLPKRIMRAVAAERGVGGAPRMPRVVWISAAAAAVAAAVILAFSFADDTSSSSGNGAVAEGRKATPSRRPPRESREPATFASVASGALELTRPGVKAVSTPAPGAPLLAGDTVRASGDEPAEIALADGTRLFLDAESEAVVAPGAAGAPGAPLADPARSVRLVAGRLFAEVEKDAEPFVVTTAFGEVTTLGTKFGVALEKGEGGETELAVSVEEGAVRVESEGEREVVRAGNGCVFRRGRRARRQSGERSREQFRWMARHRERRRRGRQGGEGGGKGPDGKGPRVAEGLDEKGPDGEGRGPAGDARRSGQERKAQEQRREQAQRRAKQQKQARQQKQAKEQKQARERRRTEERKRAKERKQAEERRRAKERKRAEERRRAEENKRAEEQRRAEEERGRGSRGRGSGGKSRGGGGRGGKGGR